MYLGNGVATAVGPAPDIIIPLLNAGYGPPRISQLWGTR